MSPRYEFILNCNGYPNPNPIINILTDICGNKVTFKGPRGYKGKFPKNIPLCGNCNKSKQFFNENFQIAQFVINVNLTEHINNLNTMNDLFFNKKCRKSVNNIIIIQSTIRMYLAIKYVIKFKKYVVIIQSTIRMYLAIKYVNKFKIDNFSQILREKNEMIKKIDEYKMKQDEKQKSCTICYNDDCELVIIAPCGHKYCCESCTNIIKTCPVCRLPINGIVKKVYD